MKKMTVAGAGAMGAGIAQVFAEAEWTVVLLDNTLELAQKGAARIEDSLARPLKKGEITKAHYDKTIAMIHPSGEMRDCEGSNLVIEAIYENLEAKQNLFAAIEKIVSEDTILVSNTSSISITQIGSVLKIKSRFAGLHFFNPAAVMKLVEIIEGMYTTPDTTREIIRIAEEIGKTPVSVNESAGFVVNRLLIPMINEAIAVYAEGVSSAEEIETAMKLGANHPMGPLALGDLIGLDVCLAIMDVLHSEMGEDKYRPHPLLKKMVRANQLGRKTGRGFFEYESENGRL